MTVEPAEFRAALNHFASGVTVVTVADAGRFHGATASSFSSVSLDPPMVLVVLDERSRTRRIAVEERAFMVNVLADDQEQVARAFAEPGPKPFGETPHAPGTGGAPQLLGALACIGCGLISVVDGGDHDILIGSVVATRIRDGKPLLYYNRAYRTL